MPRHASLLPPEAALRPPTQRPFGLLIVDPQPGATERLPAVLPGGRFRVHRAAGVAEAVAVLRRVPVDVLIVRLDLPDGSGLDLVEKVRRLDDTIGAVLTADRPSVDDATAALRAGVDDLLREPVPMRVLGRSVAAALARRADGLRQRDYHLRLKRLCRKLHHARQEHARRAEVMGRDLVGAYERLAVNFDRARALDRFDRRLRREIDLASLLQVTMDFVVERCGATNAVLFVPSPNGGFATGAYVNQGMGQAGVRAVVDHLADVAAPRLAESPHAVHFSEEAQVQRWLGDDAAYLADSHVVGVPVRRDGETLASMLLFRDVERPFDPSAVTLLSEAADRLAESLVRVVDAYHAGRDDGGPSGGRMQFESGF